MGGRQQSGQDTAQHCGEGDRAAGRTSLKRNKSTKRRGRAGGSGRGGDGGRPGQRSNRVPRARKPQDVGDRDKGCPPGCLLRPAHCDESWRVRALKLIGELADQAVEAGRPGLSRTTFVSGALKELSVALCRGNASLCQSSTYVATRASGRAPMRGLVLSSRPSTEVV
jgi:hypothetical protein